MKWQSSSALKCKFKKEQDKLSVNDGSRFSWPKVKSAECSFTTAAAESEGVNP